MKPLLVFLLVNFVCFGAHCQTEERFDYKLSESGMRYAISSKSETPVSKDARGVTGYFIDKQDEKNLRETFCSVVEKSIPSEKMQKFTGVERKMFFFINFSSISGKVIQVRMHIPKEDLEILNENDFDVLFTNLQKMEIDMSKCEIENPPNLTEGVEGIWAWVFPFPLK